MLRLSAILYVLLFFLLIFKQLALALRCYDSNTYHPRNSVECDPDSKCYSEYYSIKRESGNSLLHRFDRFCVHENHCAHRGIKEACVSLDELDSVVRRTFKKKLAHLRHRFENLKHTRFCCCSTDECNSLSPREVYHLFNITTFSSAISSLHCPHWLLILCVSLTLNAPYLFGL